MEDTVFGLVQKDIACLCGGEAIGDENGKQKGGIV
jgi:hypothetical protein